MPQITLTSVTKNYGTGPNAVDALDLTINDGDFMCLLGPSGCGKTTTLRMIAGLEHPTAGRIAVGDKVVDEPHAGHFVPAEARELGLVFQSYALWPHLTVADNIEYGLKVRKTPKAQRDERVAEMLRLMGIEKNRDRYPSQLSGGQQQRVALARMLAPAPDVMLLDEPLSNLDSRLRLEMRAELKRIHNTFQSTIVFVTHDQWEAMTLATRVAVMKDGVLQQVGSPVDIYDRPATRFVAEFLGVPPINFFDFDDPHAVPPAVRDFLAARGVPAERLGSVGIRPEAFSVAAIGEGLTSRPDDLVLRGRVESIMPTGGSWTTDLIVGGRHVYVTDTRPANVGPGEEVDLRAPHSALHVFDRDGDRVKVAA